MEKVLITSLCGSGLNPMNKKRKHNVEEVAWIATHESGLVYHFARADGWRVYTVVDAVKEKDIHAYKTD